MQRALSPTAEHQALPATKTAGKSEGGVARVCLVAITGAHGVKGRVRIKSFTADPSSIASYGPLSDESGERRFVVEVTGESKGTLLAEIDGVDDRDAADALRGTRLYVDRSALPAPEEEEFYQADLIGLAALRGDGSTLGKVVAVNDFGAGASLEIADEAGKTVLVPFTSAAVPVIDIAGGMLVVEPPVGLLDPAPQAEEASSTAGEASS
jgi:16S rRNA processing protein RimM